MGQKDHGASYTLRNKIGLCLGPILFTAFQLFVDLDPENPLVNRMAACTLWMATWWITEAVPIPITSLLPLVLFPLLKIQNAKETAPSYTNTMIFLFMGGFIIALAIERWKLHRRIALSIIRIIGSSERRIVLGFMVATALLSMWISNTATAMMMLPIGLAVIAQMKPNSLPHERGNPFGTALMLGIAYAASIGGIGTLIGTPPNLVLQGVLDLRFPDCDVINFQTWIFMAFPFSAVFLIIAWALLVYWLFPLKKDKIQEKEETLLGEYRKLGPMTKPERRVLMVFVATALLWIFRKNIEFGFIKIPGWSNLMGLEKGVNDSTVAVFMAMVLFILPSGEKRFAFLMDWKTAIRLPWGILLLFGGGLALAKGMETSGLSEWLGKGLKASLGGAPEWVLILSVCLMITFLTEITSNTATVQMILPILASAAIALSINPLLLMVPATLSASCAFMLPVATPPNAIVFGSGCVPMATMARAGLVLNLTGALIILFIASFLARVVFGIESNVLPLWAH